MTAGEAEAAVDLVFGASGYIGSHLVEHLVERNRHQEQEQLLAHGDAPHNGGDRADQSAHMSGRGSLLRRRVVRACARRKRVLEDRWADQEDWWGWHGDGADGGADGGGGAAAVSLVQADALAPETLPAVLEGVDVAYYLVHSMGSSSTDFDRLDTEAADNFAGAASAAGVRRIVYLGGLLPASAAASEHLRSRASTGERLRRGGSVAVTEIRAGIIVGPGSVAFEVIRDLVNHLPVMVTPRWVSSRMPPIALDNLLEYLAAVPHVEGAAGKILDAPGPAMMSYASLMTVYAKCVGRRIIILPVPVLTPWLSAWWLYLVTSVPTSTARALIAGLAGDIPADGRELQRLVPQVSLMTYEEGVHRALKDEREKPASTRWIEGSMRYRGFRQDVSFYSRQALGHATTHASANKVWDAVTAFGSVEEGYYFADWIWKLRGWMDRVIGGPGFGELRDLSEAGTDRDLSLGDRIGSWEVIHVEAGRTLALQMHVKAPGAGVLQFSLEPLDEDLSREPSDASKSPQTRTRVTVTAYWHPAGVWGLLYWAAAKSRRVLREHLVSLLSELQATFTDLIKRQGRMSEELKQVLNLVQDEKLKVEEVKDLIQDQSSEGTARK